MSRVSPTPPAAPPAKAAVSATNGRHVTFQPTLPEVPETQIQQPGSKTKAWTSAVEWRDPRSEEGGPKPQAVAFLLVTGLLMMAGGAALLWVALHTGLQDFFILGPGGLVIGLGLIGFAAILVGRQALKRRRRRREEEEREQEAQERVPLNEYTLPLVPALPQTKQPVCRNQLYGKDDPARARRVSVFMNDARVTPLPAPSHASAAGVSAEQQEPVLREVAPFYEKELGKLPPPSVALPQSVSETLADREDTFYKVPVMERKSAGRRSREASCESISKVAVYVPDTPPPHVPGLPPVYEPPSRRETPSPHPQEPLQDETSDTSLKETVDDSNKYSNSGTDASRSSPRTRIQGGPKHIYNKVAPDQESLHSVSPDSAIESLSAQTPPVTEM